jgi:hypothetical protein
MQWLLHRHLGELPFQCSSVIVFTVCSSLMVGNLLSRTEQDDSEIRYGNIAVIVVSERKNETNDSVSMLQTCIISHRLDKVERTNCNVVCLPSGRARCRGRYLINTLKN